MPLALRSVPEAATIQALRTDVALQIARHQRQLGISQLRAAKQWRIPQPTLSKIANGRISDLSLELLLRIAVRAGLPMTLQTGRVPQEAGAFVSARQPTSSRPLRSRLADEAREASRQAERRLSPAKRLEAFLEHNQLIALLHRAGHAAETERVRRTPREP